MKHLGVTGTRRGATVPQMDALWEILEELQPTHLHHGDCKGVDAQAAVLADALGIATVAHPPLVSKYRAFHASTEVRPLAPYLERDRDIVGSVEVLVGLPDSLPRSGSGTWYTINWATWMDVPVRIVYPDGTSPADVQVPF
jgi:hypothetical protein